MIGDNTLPASSVVANDTRDSAFLATSVTTWSFRRQVLGSFTYPRAMLDGRQYGCSKSGRTTRDGRC